MKMNAAQAQANDIMVMLGKNQGKLNEELAALAAAKERLAAEFGPRIEPLQAAVRLMESDLITYVKKHQVEIFGERDLADLPAGRIIWNRAWKVVRTRDFLMQLKRLGKIIYIKIAESVDWDTIEKLTDEQIVDLGLKRKLKEEVTYELR